MEYEWHESKGLADEVLIAMNKDDEGKLFMPGHRICDLKDCVNSNHVIAPAVATVSHIDLILGMHELQQHNRRANSR
jgi:hypothetical protein